jgi:hypothetical protein
MRKNFLYPVVFLTVFFTQACYVEQSSVTKYFSQSTGFVYMAALIEMNSNFSSLLYDKTKARKDSAFESKYDNTSLNPNIYVLPVKIETPNEFHYDDSMRLVLKNYIKANKFGHITENSEAANYHLVTKVKESFNSYYGKNSSYVEITLVDSNNKPFFFTNVKMISKSDNNFFYFPRKGAKPVSYLTVKGFEYLLRKSLYNAFIKEEKQKNPTKNTEEGNA